MDYNEKRKLSKKEDSSLDCTKRIESSGREVFRELKERGDRTVDMAEH